MEDLQTIKNIVKSILETDEKARNSDKYLIWLIFKEYTKSNMSFSQFSLCPNMESIRRCRQLIQSENSELKGNDEIQELRENRREEFRNLNKVDEPKEFIEPTRSIHGVVVNHTIKKGIAMF